MACVTALIAWLTWPWFFFPDYTKSRAGTPEGDCRNSLRAVDSAKEQWALTQTGVTNGTRVAVTNILAYIKNHRLPECRRGGDYGIGVIGQEPRCTAHGTIAEIEETRVRKLKKDKAGATACLAAYFAVAFVLAILPVAVTILSRKRRPSG